jgi:DNA-directed RNA polymerase subunit RPC12/RpoP
MMTETNDEKTDMIEYTCERCGYRYKKLFDYPPTLCYRCMRFMAKRNWTIVHTIQPMTSRPEIGEV